ncbi:MAG: hypothetical protein JWQ09_422 [Segetibacter sp.]|nr:hypothetical protein [Segetibacter sp.]
MEPLNQPQRRKAFINFLIFFTITAILIIATVFLSVQVPFKQNDQLREQMSRVEKEKDFTEVFLNKMNATNNLLDSLDKKDGNVDLIDGKIKEKLTDMDAMIEKDSLAVKDLYQNIVANLSQIHAAKKELRDATSKDASLGDLKQQISQLKDDLARSQNNVVILQTQLAMQRRD